jgi:hypothetical protein
MNLERSWTGKREHRNLSFQLAYSTASELRGLVVPLLRSAFHELLIEAHARHALEVDESCIVWMDDHRSPLIGLCQVFQQDEICGDELQSCRRAIHAFAESSLRTNIFLFIHNRDGRDSGFRKFIQADLDHLVASGRTERAELWNRQRLLKEAFNGMLRYTFASIQRKNLSTAPIEAVMRHLPFLPLEEVPCSTSRLVFDRYQLKSKTLLAESIEDPANAILDRRSGSLFLLTGSFGLGKTTAVARALARESAHLLYVAGARISSKIVRGTKDYLQHSINERELFEDFPGEEHPILAQLVRPVLQGLLHDPDTPLIMVIDGIDESGFLSRQGSFQRLFNILQEIAIPVVLTMRTEFWEKGEESFASFAGIPSRHGEPWNRRVLRIELGPWNEEQIRLLIARYRDSLEEPEARARLAELDDHLCRGELARLFDDIPRRPLFLRLLLDTVAETGLPTAGTGRARLLHDWARLKLHRDVNAPIRAGGKGRLKISAGTGSEAASLQLAWEAMLWAAASMTELVEGVYELTPDCLLESILRSTESLRRIEDPLGLFLNTLLLPAEPSLLGGPLRVRFAHRAFQEFFLAWFSLLYPGNLHESPLPGSVLEWAAQIEAEKLMRNDAPEAQPFGAVDGVERTDLEIRVSLELMGGETRLRFVLSSPSGKIDVSFLDILGPPFAGSPEGFRTALILKLERLGRGFDIDESLLVHEEVRDKLIGIGRDLYKEIFPAELRAVYRKIRKDIRTLMITSAEPWIPWELIRPYDVSDPADPVDDDFLCLQFELTRWMTGRPPVRLLEVRKIASIRAADDLPSSAAEQSFFSRLADRHPGIVDAGLPAPTSETVKTLLKEGGLQLIHFVAHGTFDPAQPNEAGLPMPDGISLRPVDLHGVQVDQDRPLVFLNACRAAQQGWSLTGLGGWAERWIRHCGCGVFVGPIWAVSDRLALCFAEAFYIALEKGETFGKAAQTARQAVQKIAPSSPARLAYSVYAHPNGRLVFPDL